MTWIFVLKPPRLRPSPCAACPPFFCGACRAGVRSDYRAVYHTVFHVWVCGKMGKHPLPHDTIAPAPKPLIDAVPLPIRTRQQSPLRAAPTYPNHAFYEPSRFLLVANIRASVTTQKVPYLHPLFVGQYCGCHPTTLVYLP